MKYNVKFDNEIIDTIELDDTSDDEAIESVCDDLGLLNIGASDADWDGDVDWNRTITRKEGIIQYDIEYFRSDSAAATFTIEPVESSQS